MNPTLARCREMLSNGSQIEDVLRVLREEGLSKIESMKALMDLTGMPLAKAKDTVHLSAAWADTYEAHERFHDLAEESLKNSDPQH